jgi:excisionase family DNA binding protein
MNRSAQKELSSPLLTVRELAGCLQVHESTIYGMLRQKTIPSFRIGGDWRFDRTSIEHWMSDGQVRHSDRN